MANEIFGRQGLDSYFLIEKMTEQGMRYHLSRRHAVNWKKVEINKLDRAGLIQLHTDTPALVGKQNRTFEYGHSHE